MFPTPQRSIDASRRIPRTLFQTWETRAISNELQAIINTWKDKNPKNGNEDIKEIYAEECDALHVVHWVTNRPF